MTPSLGAMVLADLHEIPITTVATQMLTLDAGSEHANLSYMIFGSFGTEPGIDLFGMHIPLNPDIYTDIVAARLNDPVFANFMGTLNAIGQASASFNVPAMVSLPVGTTFHHAYIVYDASGRLYMVSNAVPARLK